MRTRSILIGGLASLLALYLLTGVAFIRPGERAVVRRFGRVVETPGPGLRLGFPWGIDRVDRIAVDQVRRVRVGYQPASDEAGPATPPGQLVTGDHNLVNVQAVVDYTVLGDQIEDYLVQASRVDDLVERAAESALAEWIAARKVDDVLGIDKSTLPDWLARRTQERIEPYRLGVRIQGASILLLAPPDQVRSAFEEVTRAQTRVQTERNDAQQKAAQLRRRAEADRYQLERETDAYVNRQLELARTEAAAFRQRLEQYRQLQKDNPHILAAIWWDEMGKLFTRMRANGRIDLLDHYLAGDGLDITIFGPQAPKR